MKRYCASVYRTERFKTREVMVGSVGVGGNNPVRIQSMTTSSTRDVEATIDQVMLLSDQGCEIARLTVQGIKEAEACEHIKNGLLKKGYTIPLVADIHFFPAAAMRVVDFVDKIRINPGNFVDKRASFKVLEYDDATYRLELERIEEKFAPLIEKCKLLKKALRIGTNHGSLSDRIMNRYGDTPFGMVESALEYARVCRKYDFHHFVFSMKASNPQVMILAYRLLAAEMLKLGWDYPLHLGVTEAGEGEDGRIKSAMGIGTLLLDGLGDTIRVSLTEDPWHEIDPCKRLVAFAASYEGKGVQPFEETFRTFDALKKREVAPFLRKEGKVVLTVNAEDLAEPDFYTHLGCEVQFGRPQSTKSSVDLIQVDQGSAPVKHLKEAHIEIVPLVLSIEQACQYTGKESYVIRIKDEDPKEWESLKTLRPLWIALSPTDNRLQYARHFFEFLQAHQLFLPVILNFNYTCSKEDLTIACGAEYGALLADGLGEGVWIEGPYELPFLRALSLNILQAARMRIFKTEFISCPGCGRTLFNLQEVSKRIRDKTGHLAGVRIAIMGCIVNGPGEMADADFGYVGSKTGMVDLYIGKQCVQKDIPFDDADERLIDLIKDSGMWIDPPLLVPAPVPG